MNVRTLRFTFEKQTPAVDIKGTADVYGPGSIADAKQFLRGMLGDKSLRVTRVRGRVITVRASDGR